MHAKLNKNMAEYRKLYRIIIGNNLGTYNVIY